MNTKLLESISAKDFGAIGDDTNDDTAELQAAIDAQVATGGSRKLALPPGTFKLSDKLTLYSDFELVGHASGKSILKGATGWVTNTPIVNVDGLSRVRIRNIGFAFAAANNSTPALRFNNSTDCLVEDCRFDANGAWSIYIGGGSQRIVVSRVISEGTCQQHNVEINASSYNVVVDCTLKNSSGNGVEIYHAGADTSTRGNQICRNYIYAPASTGIGTFGDLETVIANNVIVDSRNPGIYMTISEVTSSVIPTGCTVTGNTLLGCGVANTTSGLTLASGLGITVSGNVVRGAGNDGMYISGSSHAIIGNTVYLSKLNGIYVANGSHTFTGNTILNSSTASSGASDGISVASGSTKNLITGNRIADTRTPKLQRYGILLTTGANTNYVANNELSSNLTGNYFDSGTGNSILDAGSIVASSATISGLLTLSTGIALTKSQNALTSIAASNTNTGTSAQAASKYTNNAGSAYFGIASSGSTIAGALIYTEGGIPFKLWTNDTLVMTASGSSTGVTFAGVVTVAGLTVGEAGNLIVGTTTGTKIGTATTQKLSLWNKTPIIQPTALTVADASTVDATYGSEEATVLANVRTRINELETRLTAFGFLP